MDGETIVCVPLPEEMKYAYDFMKSIGGTTAKSYDPQHREYSFSYQLTSRRRARVGFLVIGDMGNLRTAVRMPERLLDLRPRFLFLIGLAGSLNPRTVRLGDVVISTEAKLFYPDKVKSLKPGETFVPGTTPPGPHGASIMLDERKTSMLDSYFRYRRDYQNFEVSEAWVAKYLEYIAKGSPPQLKPITGIPLPKAEYENLSPTIRQGVVFGSEMVVDCPKFVDFIHDKNQREDLDYYYQKRGPSHDRRRWVASELDIVDMETFGFLSMVKSLERVLPTPHAFSVRSVSDFAEGKEELDATSEDKVRDIAVTNAMRVTIDILDFLDRQVKGA